MIRGDSPEADRLARAIAFARARGLSSDSELAPLFDADTSDADPDVLKLLRQMHEAGGWVLVESTLADLPADLRWLYESGAVTLEQLAAVHRDVGIASAADIAAAIAEQRLSGAGFDESLRTAIAGALPKLRASIPRIPLGRAVAAAEPILERLRGTPGVSEALTAGSLRRGQEMVGDIEILAPTTHPADAIDAVLQEPEVVRCLHRSERRVYVLMDRVQIGVLLPEPAHAAPMLLYRTGSAQHFDQLRARAAARNLALDSRGLVSDGSRVETVTEAAIYDALGLPFIPPEIRNGDDELAAADAGTLPRLVTREDIRGDLHMHSMWSDGRDPIEQMVQACVALGYEYLAITDHSQRSAASRNLTMDGVAKQAEEIERLRERYPAIAILHGCEVDIMPDGRLDFPDQMLERFDIVLASLHERAGQSSDQLMKRYADAMKHPLVTLITHPTNRLVPNRKGYDLDYDRLFELAAQTRTALEVDGAPAHLDLDGELTRRAIAAGATLAVDSDCHRSDFLERQMQMGLMTARRGWAEPRHVLNTRPLAEVRGFIAAKRGSL